MSLKSSITFLIVIFILMFSPFGAISKMDQENQLTKAIQLFDKGKFAEAEPIFKMLIDEKPDDFMINYFYGACRTENKHYSLKNLNYLVKASKEVSPLDIDYYLGIQYQAQENWEQALKHYNKYGKSASDEDLRKANLTEKIQQCYDRENPYQLEESTDEMSSETPTDVESILVTTDSNSIIPDDTMQNLDTGNLTKNDIKTFSTEIAPTGVLNEIDSTSTDLETMKESIDTLSVAENVDESDLLKPQPPKTTVNFSVNSEITYRLLSQFKNQEGRELFESAQVKQKQLDSTLQTLDFLRKKYVSVYSRNEKDSIGQLILSLENYSYELKNETNKMLIKSKALENEYWQNASENEVLKFIAESNKIVEKPLDKNENLSTVLPDSEKVMIPEILIDDASQENQSVSASSGDLIYKIQIGAYSRGIPNYKKALFNKISLIRKIENYTDEKGVVVYTTGNLAKYEDAIIMQKQVRQEGIEDAFIVPYLKGKRITLDQAKEIEGIL